MKTNYRNNSPESYIMDTEETTVSVNIWILGQNQYHEFIAGEHNILFVTSGSLICSLQGYIDEDIGSGRMVFISMGSRCCISTTEGVSLICLKPGDILNLYNYPFYSQRQKSNNKKSENKLSVLQFTPLITAYVDYLKWFLQSGFNDPLYFGIKTRELFQLMSISYSLAERTFFFQALISSDKKFSDLIYKNYRQASSIRELATMSCYSLSGFEKRFLKVFGVSASRWIALRRADDIYHEITKTQKSIKQISFDYGFSSVSHFHKFCKTKLGLSPGYIRKQLRDR
ncbi:helix-turn-helix domain-containing protein [Dysgonomonas termitidis]|uniref:Helix-turn-helix domain-containing protein n=1 Tax=Dysgonomonas termitidis TaxID=1516126 RepID=A0ABV9KUC2_9BACT